MLKSHRLILSFLILSSTAPAFAGNFAYFCRSQEPIPMQDFEATAISRCETIDDDSVFAASTSASLACDEWARDLETSSEKEHATAQFFKERETIIDIQPMGIGVAPVRATVSANSVCQEARDSLIKKLMKKKVYAQILNNGDATLLLKASHR